MLYLIPPRSFSSFRDFPSIPNGGIHRSSYSITENETESKLEIDFPGAKPEDISVTFDQGALTISNEDQGFSKSFAVDTSKTDLDNVKAILDDGVLTVLAPKHPKPEPTSIALSSDLVDDKNSSRFTVDLPGVKADNVSVTLDNSYIVVKASRLIGGDMRELCKSFEVNATAYNHSNITACLQHGVLTVQVPFKPKPAPINVPIQTDESTGFEGDDDFKIAMDMPGVKAADVSVQVVQGDVLQMTATRTFSNGKMTRLSKATTLDKRVKRELLKATLVDGVLSVSAPQDPLPSPRTIAVVRKPSAMETTA